MGKDVDLVKFQNYISTLISHMAKTHKGEGAKAFGLMGRFIGALESPHSAASAALKDFVGNILAMEILDMHTTISLPNTESERFDLLRFLRIQYPDLRELRTKRISTLLQDLPPATQPRINIKFWSAHGNTTVGELTRLIHKDGFVPAGFLTLLALLHHAHLHHAAMCKALQHLLYDGGLALRALGVSKENPGFHLWTPGTGLQGDMWEPIQTSFTVPCVVIGEQALPFNEEC